MPILSMFYGIIITMYREVGGKHKTPHYHAEYQGDEVVLSLDGNVIEGSLPNKNSNLFWHGRKFITMSCSQIGSC